MKNIQVRLLRFRPNMTITPTTTKVKTKTFFILSPLIILDRVPTEMKLRQLAQTIRALTRCAIQPRLYHSQAVVLHLETNTI